MNACELRWTEWPRQRSWMQPPHLSNSGKISLTFSGHQLCAMFDFETYAGEFFKKTEKSEFSQEKKERKNTRYKETNT